ncbi:MAG: hypothetical protein FWC23_05800 [Chitinispirillia bacterium]|nr:hypothetical protein [Chitinispirillia bacterium]MCL2268681.1 hypothetical protein [Chitinispirillia bacterium]
MLVIQIMLAAGLLALLFVFFLVISKSTGVIDNTLYKMEYLVRKECDIQLEALEFKYKMRAANNAFDEAYGIKRLADDAQNATDSNE